MHILGLFIASLTKLRLRPIVGCSFNAAILQLHKLLFTQFTFFPTLPWLSYDALSSLVVPNTGASGKMISRKNSAFRAIIFGINVFTDIPALIPEDVCVDDFYFSLFVIFGLWFTWYTGLGMFFESPRKENREPFDTTIGTVDSFSYLAQFLISIVPSSTNFVFTPVVHPNKFGYDVSKLYWANPEPEDLSSNRVLMVNRILFFLFSRFVGLFSICSVLFWSYQTWLTSMYLPYRGCIDADIAVAVCATICVSIAWAFLVYSYYPYAFFLSLPEEERLKITDSRLYTRGNLDRLWDFNIYKLAFFFALIINSLLTTLFITDSAYFFFPSSWSYERAEFWASVTSGTLTLLFQPVYYNFIVRAAHWYSKKVLAVAPDFCDHFIASLYGNFDCIICLVTGFRHEHELTKYYSAFNAYLDRTSLHISPAAIGLSTPANCGVTRNESYEDVSAKYSLDSFIYAGFEAFTFLYCAIMVHFLEDRIILFCFCVVPFLVFLPPLPHLRLFHRRWNTERFYSLSKSFGVVGFNDLVQFPFSREMGVFRKYLYRFRWAGRISVCFEFLLFCFVYSLFTGSFEDACSWFFAHLLELNKWFMFIFCGLMLFRFYQVKWRDCEYVPVQHHILLACIRDFEDGIAPFKKYSIDNSPCLLGNWDMIFDYLENRIDAKFNFTYRHSESSFFVFSAAAITYTSVLIGFNYSIDCLVDGGESGWWWLSIMYMLLVALYIYFIAFFAEVQVYHRDTVTVADAILTRPRIFIAHPINFLLITMVAIHRFNYGAWVTWLDFSSLIDTDNPYYDVLEPVLGIFSVFAVFLFFITFYYGFIILSEILVSFFHHFSRWYFGPEFGGPHPSLYCVLMDFLHSWIESTTKFASYYPDLEAPAIKTKSGVVLSWNFFGQFFFTRMLRDFIGTGVIVSFLLVVMPGRFTLGYDWTVDAATTSLLLSVVLLVASWRISTYIFNYSTSISNLTPELYFNNPRQLLYLFMFSLTPTAACFAGFSFAFYSKLAAFSGCCYLGFYKEVFDVHYILLAFTSTLMFVGVWVAVIRYIFQPLKPVSSFGMKESEINTKGSDEPFIEKFAHHFASFLTAIDSESDREILIEKIRAIDPDFRKSVIYKSFSFGSCPSYPFVADFSRLPFVLRFRLWAGTFVPQGSPFCMIFHPIFNIDELDFKNGQTPSDVKALSYVSFFNLIDYIILSYIILNCFETSSVTVFNVFAIFFYRFFAWSGLAILLGQSFFFWVTGPQNKLTRFSARAYRYFHFRSTMPLLFSSNSFFEFDRKLFKILDGIIIYNLICALFIIDCIFYEGPDFVRSLFEYNPEIRPFLSVFLTSYSIVIGIDALKLYLKKYCPAFHDDLNSLLAVVRVTLDLAVAFCLMVFILFHIIWFNPGYSFDSKGISAFLSLDSVLLIVLLVTLVTFARPYRSKEFVKRKAAAEFAGWAVIYLFCSHGLMNFICYIAVFLNLPLLKALAEVLMIINANTLSSSALICFFKALVVLFGIPGVYSVSKYLALGRVTYGFFTNFVLLIWLNLFLIGIDNLLYILIIFDGISLLTVAFIYGRKSFGDLSIQISIQYFIVSVTTSLVAYFGLFIFGAYFNSFSISSVIGFLEFGLSHASWVDQRALLTFAVFFFLLKIVFLSGLFPFHNLVVSVSKLFNYPGLTYILTLSKIAPLYFLIYISKLFPFCDEYVHYFLLTTGVISSVVGSLYIATSVRLKDLFAYSSLAQMGYTFSVVSLFTSGAYAVACSSLFIYCVTTGALLYILSCALPIGPGSSLSEIEDLGTVSRTMKASALMRYNTTTEIPDFNHLQGVTAFVSLVSFLSLAGFAPTLGFFLKLNIVALLQSSGYSTVNAILLLSSLMGACGYLNFAAKAGSSNVGCEFSIEEEGSAQDFFFKTDGEDFFSLVIFIYLFFISLIFIFSPDWSSNGAFTVLDYFSESPDKTARILFFKSDEA